MKRKVLRVIGICTVIFVLKAVLCLNAFAADYDVTREASLFQSGGTQNYDKVTISVTPAVTRGDAVTVKDSFGSEYSYLFGSNGIA